MFHNARTLTQLHSNNQRYFRDVGKVSFKIQKLISRKSISQDHLRADMNKELIVQFRDDRLCGMLEFEEARKAEN